MKYDKKWLAGLLDGRGCFNIRKVVHNERNGKTYRAQVLKISADLDELKVLKEMIGGNIYNQGNGAYQLMICDKKKIQALLNDIVEFMVIRKDEVKSFLKKLNEVDSLEVNKDEIKRLKLAAIRVGEAVASLLEAINKISQKEKTIKEMHEEYTKTSKIPKELEVTKKLTKIDLPIYYVVKEKFNNKIFNWLDIIKAKHIGVNGITNTKRISIGQILRHLENLKIIKSVKRYTKTVNGGRKHFIDYKLR